MHVSVPEMREFAAAFFIVTQRSSRLLVESQIVKNATVCMAVVIAVAVVVALVAVVEVVGDIGIVVASAVAAVAVSLVVPDCFLLLSFLRYVNPPPRFLH